MARDRIYINKGHFLFCVLHYFVLFFASLFISNLCVSITYELRLTAHR